MAPSYHFWPKNQHILHTKRYKIGPSLRTTDDGGQVVPFRWVMGKQACTHACDATKGAFNRRYIEKWATFKRGHRLPADNEDDLDQDAIDTDVDDHDHDDAIDTNVNDDSAFPVKAAWIQFFKIQKLNIITCEDCLILQSI